MNILIDLTFVINSDISVGFTRVSLSLVSSFIKLGMASQLTLMVDRTSESYFKRCFSECNIVVSRYSSNKIGKIFLFRKRHEISNIIALYGLNLLFCPFISFGTVTAKNLPSIGILHDVQKLKLNNGSKIKKLLYAKRMRNIIRSFEKIVTISNSEKRHILSFFPDLSGKMKVIYNGIILCKKEITVAEVGGRSYILDINTLFEYKNALTLIKAFDKIKDQIPHFLVFKGKKTDFWENTIVPYVQLHDLQSRIILIDRILSEEELSYLYHHADVFVSPSRMEGFGLTPVEAAICGVPVICSDIDTLKETTLGLVNYFNPNDENKLAELMVDLVRKPPINLKEISQKLKSLYSVTEQAKKYAKLFETYEDNSSHSHL